MSDIFWKDVWQPWEDIVRHNEKEIAGFFGEYRWLSNFHKCNLPCGYPTIENVYMAQKVNALYREHFKQCTAGQAKKDWRKYPLVDASATLWDMRKDRVMFEWLEYKFSWDMNPDLAEKLLATESRELIELNYWKDTYWGVDLELGGENNLGKMITKIRKSLRVEMMDCVLETGFKADQEYYEKNGV